MSIPEELARREERLAKLAAARAKLEGSSTASGLEPRSHTISLGNRKALKEIAMSQDHNHLNHATWECKYHVVFTPKYRKKVLFGQIRRHLGTVFHELARRKECKIEEGHSMPDHVHILISIPPKYSVAEVIGYLKGKSSIWIAQNVERKLRNFLGHKFWARGYFVSTVGRDEEMIRTYIKNQEMADKQSDQLQLKLASS
jgi:putative transposase